MTPGFYVVRMPKNGRGSRLIVESRPFRIPANWNNPVETARDFARRSADNWRDFIQSQHPKDDVFVIEKEIANV